MQVALCILETKEYCNKTQSVLLQIFSKFHIFRLVECFPDKPS